MVNVDEVGSTIGGSVGSSSLKRDWIPASSYIRFLEGMSKGISNPDSLAEDQRISQTPSFAGVVIRPSKVLWNSASWDVSKLWIIDRIGSMVGSPVPVEVDGGGLLVCTGRPMSDWLALAELE